MAATFRRLFLKPPSATPEQLGELRDGLQAAAHAQNRLAAKSLHILQFQGALQEDEHHFFIEHEPAEPLVLGDIFDPKGMRMAGGQLVQILAALADALSAAHSAGSARSTVHGGLAPGVLVAGEDGVVKVTDFGFAVEACRALGVESYLNLAVSPCETSTGEWDVADPGATHRDDRICAFIDPDKHGQGTLSTFEAGSDIIAAGMLLYVLAEHVHPYLHSIPGAQRIVDISRMSAYGVPRPVQREDLCSTKKPALRAWVSLVEGMITREPAKRPSARQVAEEIEKHAKGVDSESIQVQRWLAQVEAMFGARQWDELEALLRDRPALDDQPVEVHDRLTTIEDQSKRERAADERRAAVERDHRMANWWFKSLEEAVNSDEWHTAYRLLDERPPLTHWPERIEQQVAPLAKRIRQVRAEHELHTWHESLQNAHDAEDWKTVATLIGKRPALEHWPQDIAENTARIEEAFEAHQAAMRAERERIAADHKVAQEWLGQAQALAAKEEWVSAIDSLAELPQIKHWPDGLREQVDELEDEYRSQLGESVVANLDAFTDSVARQAGEMARELVPDSCGGLLAPDRVETKVDFVMWAPPDTDAHGRARVVVRLTPETAGDKAEPLQGQLDFRLKAVEVLITGGEAEFRAQISQGLPDLLFKRQQAEVAALQERLRDSVFPNLSVSAQLDTPEEQLRAKIGLLGSDASTGQLEVALRWEADSLTWVPVDAAGLVSHALEIAQTITTAAVRERLVTSCEPLGPYRDALLPILGAGAAESGDKLPKTLKYTAEVVIQSGPRRLALPLAVLAVECTEVGRADVSINAEEICRRLDELLLAAQESYRAGLFEQSRQWGHTSTARARVAVQPKRITVPTDEIRFDLRPQGADPATVTGKWDTGRFAYVFSNEAQQILTKLLGETPENFGDVPVSLEAAQKRGKSRGGLFVGGAVLVLVAVSVVAYLGVFRTPAPPPAPPPAPVAPPDPMNSTVTTADGMAVANGVDTERVTVTLIDADNNPVPNHSVSLEVIAGGADNVDISAASRRSDPETGVVTFDVTSTEPKSITVRAVTTTDSLTLTPDVNIVFEPGAPAGLRYVIQPVDSDIGTPLVVAIEVLDNADADAPAANRVVDFNGAVTLQLLNPEGCAGTLAATTTVNAVNGLAEWTDAEDLTIDTVCSGYRLRAAALTFTRDSQPFSITATTTDPGAPRAAADLVRELREHMEAQFDLTGVPSAQLADLLRVFIPEDARATGEKLIATLVPLAQDGTTFADYRAASDGVVEVDIRVPLIAGAVAEQRGFVMKLEDDSWQPVYGNVDLVGKLTNSAKRALLDRVAEAREEIETHRANGELAAAYARFAASAAERAALPDEESVQALESLMEALPPRWEVLEGQLADYQAAGATDPDTGYPTQLQKTGEDVPMLLVSVPPAAPVWDELAQLSVPIVSDQPLGTYVNSTAGEREWLIYYIDARELGALESFGEAQTRAAALGRVLPTRSEWLLAALVTRGRPEMAEIAGGLYEWCADDPVAGERWVCGGATLSIQGEQRIYPQAPAAAADTETWWTWLTNPLVMQTRAQGDGLTTARTALRLYPPSTP